MKIRKELRNFFLKKEYLIEKNLFTHLIFNLQPKSEKKVSKKFLLGKKGLIVLKYKLPKRI